MRSLLVRHLRAQLDIAFSGSQRRKGEVTASWTSCSTTASRRGNSRGPKLIVSAITRKQKRPSLCPPRATRKSVACSIALTSRRVCWVARGLVGRRCRQERRGAGARARRAGTLKRCGSATSAAAASLYSTFRVHHSDHTTQYYRSPIFGLALIRSLSSHAPCSTLAHSIPA
jgi:hypothetical protein